MHHQSPELPERYTVREVLADEATIVRLRVFATTMAGDGTTLALCGGKCASSKPLTTFHAGTCGHAYTCKECVDADAAAMHCPAPGCEVVGLRQVFLA